MRRATWEWPGGQFGHFVQHIVRHHSFTSHAKAMLLISFDHILGQALSLGAPYNARQFQEFPNSNKSNNGGIVTFAAGVDVIQIFPRLCCLYLYLYLLVLMPRLSQNSAHGSLEKTTTGGRKTLWLLPAPACHAH